MLKEFKTFIMKGNVMDLAVGVIIGGAFATIVKSLTNDIIMPIVGAIFGGFDFSEYFAPLSADVTATNLDSAREQGAVLAYGSFITATVNFLILGFIIFFMIKSLNKLMGKEEKAPKAPPVPPAEVVLLGEIRDLLKTQK
ncbi:MAG: large conductance mechanosensitive channel protein MscL [Proteobacteria bacterium]|nr:large conductance mechanosensitive channel protein MscL [Pseudomonadota bacterium]